MILTLITYRLNFKWLLITSLFLASLSSFAQESIFTGMQSNWKKAEKSFSQGRYSDAINHYQAAKKQKRTPKEVHLKMALAYIHLNNHQLGVEELSSYYRQTQQLPDSLYYQWAESESILGNYQQAIARYKQYQKLKPEDNRVAAKIWRLQNIQYLYEDSVYFSVQPVPWNTAANEYGVSTEKDQLIFVSDRSGYGGVKVLDGASNKPFYKRRVITLTKDSVSGAMNYHDLKPLSLPFDSKYHHGPISFSADSRFAAFTQTSSRKQEDGSLPILAYWVQKIDDQWQQPQQITTIAGHRSIRNPVLSDDGKVLIFSAQLNDNLGGRDLYICTWEGQKWSDPKNLGHKINTKGDEDYPFIHANQNLYFASNGHSGLGGYDVFEVHLRNNQIGQVKNMGYPVNTQFDDFGLSLERDFTFGFITSNRNGVEAQDDVFYLEVDLQSYPLTISGNLKYRNDQWEEDRLELVSNAEMQLFDTYSNRVVFTTTSNQQGQFKLEIPYSSQYKIKISHKVLGLQVASLEIPKNKKEHRNHEIVVVEEQFASEVQQLEDE